MTRLSAAKATALSLMLGAMCLTIAATWNSDECGLGPDIEIVLKEHDPEALQNKIFTIKAKEIEGEASLASVPNSDIGNIMVHSQIVGLKSTFSSMRAPYSGHITALIECKAQDYLKELGIPFGSSATTAILAVATQQRIVGACALEQIKYASAFWAGYDDEHNQVVSIKLFKPIADLQMVDQYQEDLSQTLIKITRQPRWYRPVDSCSKTGGKS